MPAPLGYSRRDDHGLLGWLSRWHLQRRTRRVSKALAARRELGALAVVAAVVALGSPASADPAVIAHRGGGWSGVTEGSMGAIKQSHAQGLDWFEVDARTTASDTMYVMHDATVDRTTTGTGLVSSKTTAQMGALRLVDGQAVPSVNTVLAYAASSGMRVVLHIKSMTPESWDLLATRIRSYALQDEVTLMGPRGLMLTGNEIFSRVRTVQLSQSPIAAASVTPLDGVAIAQAVVTAADVDQIHAAGLTYWAFSPDEPDRWDAMAAAGVDAMFVDDLRAFQAYAVGS